MLSEMVQEHDEPILKHLFDIKVIFLESNPMVSLVKLYTDMLLHTTLPPLPLHSVTSSFEIKSSGI